MYMLCVFSQQCMEMRASIAGFVSNVICVCVLICAVCAYCVCFLAWYAAMCIVACCKYVMYLQLLVAMATVLHASTAKRLVDL